MKAGFLKIPYAFWGGAAILIALIFAVIVPAEDKVNATSGIRFIILRWFHSLCWVLLAANFFLRIRGQKKTDDLANVLGTSGGAAYALYLINYVGVTSA